MLAAVIRRAGLAVVLGVLAWMCRPLVRLTQVQLDTLQRIYDASGIHPVEFALFKDNRFIDGHYDGIVDLMRRYPDWVPPAEVHAIIGAETWRQQFGARIWQAFVSGTDCRCCLGWRVVALAAGSALLGWVAG